MTQQCLPLMQARVRWPRKRATTPQSASTTRSGAPPATPPWTSTLIRLPTSRTPLLTLRAARAVSIRCHLTGDHQVLDLTSLSGKTSAAKVSGIEAIDLGGSHNMLKLSRVDVLNLAEPDLFQKDGKQQMLVNGSHGDSVDFSNAHIASVTDASLDVGRHGRCWRRDVQRVRTLWRSRATAGPARRADRVAWLRTGR